MQLRRSRTHSKYREQLLETRDKLQQGWICFIPCNNQDQGMEFYHDISSISTFKIQFTHKYKFKSDYSIFHPEPSLIVSEMTYQGIELYL